MSTRQPDQARTVSSQVTVAVDPETAFAVFTDEMDLWWVRGPINFHDAARAVGMRCEHGVGGRLLELYAADASDALELGRITAWAPGQLLAWDSSVDDVRVEVCFAATAGGSTDGTTVTVTATIPAGGARRGRQRVGASCAWLARRLVRSPGTARRARRKTSAGLAWPCPTPGRARPLAGSPEAFRLSPAAQHDGDEDEGLVDGLRPAGRVSAEAACENLHKAFPRERRRLRWQCETNCPVY